MTLAVVLLFSNDADGDGDTLLLSWYRCFFFEFIRLAVLFDLAFLHCFFLIFDIIGDVSDSVVTVLAEAVFDEEEDCSDGEFSICAAGWRFFEVEKVGGMTNNKIIIILIIILVLGCCLRNVDVPCSRGPMVRG